MVWESYDRYHHVGWGNAAIAARSSILSAPPVLLIATYAYLRITNWGLLTPLVAIVECVILAAITLITIVIVRSLNEMVSAVRDLQPEREP